MAAIAWVTLGISLLAFGLAVVEGYLRGREMRGSVEGSDRLH